VTKSGALTGCSILSESPADFGFGQATLSVTHVWKIRPKSVDGQPTEGGTFLKTVVWVPPPPD
jgi:protein TonB